MESNMEFRIWDKKKNEWASIEDVYINIEGKVFQNYEAGLGYDESEWFEVSQYIGRKDSKGVKAFTGDMVEYSVGDGVRCGEIIMHMGQYIVKNETEGVPPLTILCSGFTIVGNKWEGLHAAGAKPAIENFSGSTGQQQRLDCCMKNFKYFADNWRQEYNSLVDAHMRLPEFKFNTPENPFYIKTDVAFKFRNPDDNISGPEMTRRCMEDMDKNPPYVRSLPLWEYKNPFSDEANKRMQEDLDVQFYAGRDKSAERYSYKQKWEHEADRLSYLSRIVMQCKSANKPSPIGVMTEINDLLNYKVDTRTAQ